MTEEQVRKRLTRLEELLFDITQENKYLDTRVTELEQQVSKLSAEK